MTPARTRLLVVDDDRTVLAALVAGLSRAGFDVVVATNGDEARRVAADARPALAVLDAQMAGDGLDAVELLARESHVRSLVLVPARDEEARRRAASAGALGVVGKPVDMAKLVPAVRAALLRADEPAPPAPAGDPLADALEGTHGPQALIALGILVERHKVNCDEAVRLLQRRAQSAERAVDEVALAVIEEAERAARPPV